MVHDNLAAAADRIAAMDEHAANQRQLALRAMLELAEQCAPDCVLTTQSLAGFLAFVLGDNA